MNFDPETYGSELSPGAGCGPDLYDTEPAFAALMDSCEEMLPERFTDFDRSEIEFTDIFKQMEGFLKQSRDLRLLIMNGSIPFADCLAASRPAKFGECSPVPISVRKPSSRFQAGRKQQPFCKAATRGLRNSL